MCRLPRGCSCPRLCPAGPASPRLSDEEVIAVATELTSGGKIVPLGGADVGVAITKLTDEVPSPEDTERVKRRLTAVGWPVSDAFDGLD